MSKWQQIILLLIYLWVAFSKVCSPRDSCWSTITTVTSVALCNILSQNPFELAINWHVVLYNPCLHSSMRWVGCVPVSSRVSRNGTYCIRPWQCLMNLHHGKQTWHKHKHRIYHLCRTSKAFCLRYLISALNTMFSCAWMSTSLRHRLRIRGETKRRSIRSSFGSCSWAFDLNNPELQ